MPQQFTYTSFDLTSQLPETWQDQILATADGADFRDFPPTPVLTREAEDVARIPRGRVHADQVKLRLPWLYELYRGHLLALVASTRAEPVSPARDDRYGVVLNVQRGTSMRFECHVDSNPLTGLLFCTDQPEGSGGELVFAHDPKAASVSAVERDCSVIRPRAGHLIVFDGRRHPHYARRLRSRSDVRVTAVMNYYTASFPESTRPPGLNRHLFGKELAIRAPRRSRAQVPQRRWH
jgi:2-oxoglutarate-Fe(II)-dependent oxygenase superfamily protein